MPLIDTGPFEHSDVRVKAFYRTKSLQLPTRMQKTVETMSSALESVQRSGSEVQGGVAGAFVLRKEVRGR